MKTTSIVLVAGALMLASCVAQTTTMAAPPPGNYEIGGPLAGLKLPPNPREGGATRGLPYHEVELYPGASEHFRAYWLKYCPVRSFFDQQSQLQNFVAPNIPGGEGRKPEQFAPPVYQSGRDNTGAATGRVLGPVRVIRCAVKDPVFRLDLGDLGPGLYAVRVIGAVETAKLKPVRDPLFLAVKINDRPDGEATVYRQRVNYVDDFYSVAEIYFHAPEQRRYRAEVWVDDGSRVDLLVSNISLDDALAGTTRRAIKTRRTLVTDEELAAIREKGLEPNLQKNYASDVKPYTPEARLARDEAIWNLWPPVNVQPRGSGYTPSGHHLYFPLGTVLGVPDKTDAQIAAEYGTWEPAAGFRTWGPSVDPQHPRAFLVNRRLKLEYTLDDYLAHRPLPDPYPYKDDGTGLVSPDPHNPRQALVHAPIAAAAEEYFRGGSVFDNPSIQRWLETGNPDFARDAAVYLIRFAYEFPTIDDGDWLASEVTEPGLNGRDVRFRQRMMEAFWLGHYGDYPGLLRPYDLLFDYLRGNEELAKSIHRFVPSVNTSQDVIALLDTYLVQTLAKRILRYHYHTIAAGIVDAATVLGDPQVGAPWMEWFFSRAFVYPLRPAGMQDLMITGCDREGPQYIGSGFYAAGEGAAFQARATEGYVRVTGDRRYDLGDPSRSYKPLAHCWWDFNILAAGWDGLRIGDVTGPEKAPGRTIRAGVPGGVSATGWGWSNAPAFAWCLVNQAGRHGQTDAEWQMITAAAATVQRAPWLDLRSREVFNWATILETGLEHDDYRFRRSVYVRNGVGTGHEHADTFDLQIDAHGLAMTPDGGQRSGYTKPNDRFSRIHNTVAIEPGNNTEYGLRVPGWTQSLSDADGARFLQVNAAVGGPIKLYRRQVALIDVDEGQGSQPLTVKQQLLREKLPAGVTTPDSYVFDVFRVSGGIVHSYCFHGPVQDDFQMNAQNVQPVAEVPVNRRADTEADTLAIFEMSNGKKFAGDAPDVLEATWRYSREPGITGNEAAQAIENFDPQSPRQFTRLHLLGARGLRALTADIVSTHFNYRITDLLAQKRGPNLESAFTAIIEPYAGEPFLAGEQLLEVADNETDALRAVAVEVTTRNGHTDLCFADGRPVKIREVSSQRSAVSRQESKTGGRASLRAANVRVSGEFAYCSTDSQGLRQAALTGGTLLETPAITIKTAVREYTGKIVAVEYGKRTLRIDRPWPACAGGQVFEIEAPRRTSYTSASVQPDGAGATITVTRGADFFRSPITQVLPEKKQVDAALRWPMGAIAKGFVVSNDRCSKIWRTAQAAGNQFTLDGPVAAADFAPENVVRLWEYGVGDAVRQSTFVGVRRTASGEYEVQGDVDAEIVLGGKTHRVTAAEFARNGGKVRLKNGD